MNPRVARRSIASGGCNVAPLLPPGRHLYMDARAKCVAMAVCCLELQLDPIRGQLRRIAIQHFRLTVEHGHHDIDVTIVVEIAERRAAPRQVLLEYAATRRRDIRELAVDVADEQRWLNVANRWVHFFNVVEYVTLRHEQILPAVVIEIQEPRTPARHEVCDPRQVGLSCSVRKEAVAVVLVEGVQLFGEIGDDLVGKLSILLVVKQKLRDGIVRHGDVRPAVRVVVIEGHP